MKKETLVELSKSYLVPKIYSLEEAKESNCLFAVRSNDSSEDSKQSKAGFYKSKLFVKPENLESAIKEVLDSGADSYFIQEMIDSDFSAVVLTKGENIFITINNGLCEGITSGKVTGINYHFKNGELIKQFGKQDKSALAHNGIINIFTDQDKNFDYKDIEKIIELTNKLKENSNINLELSFKKGFMYILQKRSFNTK